MRRNADGYPLCGCGYHRHCYDGWQCSMKGLDPDEVRREQRAEERHRDLLQAIKDGGQKP
jgi:hypothetical protein